MTDWDPRELKIKLDFLPDGTYELQSWSDGVNADRNGQDFRYRTEQVSSGDTLTLKLAPGAAGWDSCNRATAGGKVSLNTE